MERELMLAILKELEEADTVSEVISKMELVLTICDKMPSYMVDDVIRAAFGIEKG